jgi:hypothetical protein
MHVKKTDINSMDISPKGKSVITIRLKMYDHSYGFIILTKDNNNEHILRFEDKRESFIFNFTNAYLENSSGVRFKCDNPTTEQLKSRSLESFALHIIHNNKPAFCLTHYLMVLKILHKVKDIIIQDF